MCTLPCDWSKAMVVPVHKKSNKDSPANYRPISLTCLACKLMEHIVLSHLNTHLSANGILSPLQHGFRAGMSCETQLALTCHDWANILNQQGQVDALLLDSRRPLTRSVTLSYYISSVSTESAVRHTSGYPVSFKTAPNSCLLMALTPILFLSPLVCRKALYLVQPYSYTKLLPKPTRLWDL